ncbi:GreA/GreB family elongation factor [Sphingomonas sp. DT-204]|uniref:GreA/GreB family elongation factor n=1 Tax=Sphingomonas sp. DT-204 TaxID=3396166 RepID=UPI003F1991F9
MSVAFRRESDDEHKEPAFELPIPVGPNLVTPRGLELLAARDAEMAAAVAAATDEDELKRLRREQRYWATRRATAELAPPPEPGVAGIGSEVVIRRAGAEQRFRIVGHDEADPAAGLLAFTAPLARAVMDAEAGDRVDFGGRTEAIDVVSVAP